MNILVKENKILSEQLNTLVMEREDLITDLSSVKKDNINLQERIKFLQEKEQEIANQLTNYQEDSQSLLVSQEEKIKEFQQKIKELVKQNKELVIKDQSLSKEYTDFKLSEKSTINNYLKQNQELEEEIKSLKEETLSMSFLKNEIMNKELMIKNLKQELDSISGISNNTKSEVLQQYENTINALQHKIADLEAKLQNQTDSHLSKLSQMQGFMTNSMNQGNHNIKEVEGLKKDKIDLEIKHAQLIVDFENLVRENKILQVDNSILEKNQISHEKNILILQRQLIEKDKEIIEVEKKMNMKNVTDQSLLSKQSLNLSDAKQGKYESQIEKLLTSENNLKMQVSRLDQELIINKRLYNDLLRQKITNTGPDQTPDMYASNFKAFNQDNQTSVNEDDYKRQSRAFDLSMADRALKDPEFANLYDEVILLRDKIAHKNDVIKQQEKNLKLCNDLAFRVAGTLEEMGVKCKKMEDSSALQQNREKELTDRLATMTDVIAELRKRNQSLEKEKDELKKLKNLKSVEDSQFDLDQDNTEPTLLQNDNSQMKESRSNLQMMFSSPEKSIKGILSDHVNNRTQERNYTSRNSHGKRVSINTTIEKTTSRKKIENKREHQPENKIRGLNQISITNLHINTPSSQSKAYSRHQLTNQDYMSRMTKHESRATPSNGGYSMRQAVTARDYSQRQMDRSASRGSVQIRHVDRFDKESNYLHPRASRNSYRDSDY